MPAPPATPTAEPVFASDEEALAAAKDAYRKYLAVLDAILAEGGVNGERLLDVASSDVLAQEEPGFRDLQSRHLRGSGSTATTVTLQSADLMAGEVVAYACDDISSTDILDADGNSVVGGPRTTRFAYEVAMGGRPLIVQSRLPWSGSGVCD